ncbi:reverse transcriptase-like protein [Candidatus Saccharibacteria bacterium]|nr:reverse transcriptase-like protein [Candidatus Saccharibacteria bacterium]
MKQRIRVAGLIKTANGILILKRNRGRSEAPAFWELPTGKIKLGEQPEESMARSLAEYTGLTATAVRLKDVITFLALEGASRLSNLYIIYEIEVLDDQKPTPRDRYTAYKYIKDFTSSSSIRLNEATSTTLEIVEGRTASERFSLRDTASSATIYVDGASRGNPGPSGIGYVVTSADGRTLEQGGEFIGFATSRVAEYYAMRAGIEHAIRLGLKSVHFVSDSLMVVNQLNGVFAVKNQDIMPIYDAIQGLLNEFDSVSFTHVPRSENASADAEANRAIDSILYKNTPI